MKISHVSENHPGFEVLETTPRSQSAAMVLRPGEASSEEPSVHPKSDQTVIVIQGAVSAEVGSKTGVQLVAGDAVTVPAGTPHRFVNQSQGNAVTFSVYSPPEY